MGKNLQEKHPKLWVGDERKWRVGVGGIIHDLRASAATRKKMQATKMNLHKFTYKISVAENVDFMSTIY